MKVISVVTIVMFCLTGFANAQAPDQIIFSHQLHAEDVGAACTDCHANASSSLSQTDNLLPAMETCNSCHDPDEVECAMCHTNTDEPGVAQRVVDYGSKFPHKTHVSGDKNCLTCHQGIDKKEKVGSSHIPDNQVCATCHENPDYSENKQACLSCHESDMKFVPETHRLNWKKDHGMMSQTTSCNHCHQNSYCTTCHEGDNLNREVHPLNFRQTHGMQAKGNKDNCLTCHEEFSFCIDCHQTERVMPQNHAFANWSNTVPGNGGRHARVGRSDFDNCMSCHNDAYTDVVCVTCHGK
ncbi:MAG: cytochrome c3 family protein [Calditrichaceae bacterium]